MERDGIFAAPLCRPTMMHAIDPHRHSDLERSGEPPAIEETDTSHTDFEYKLDSLEKSLSDLHSHLTAPQDPDRLPPFQAIGTLAGEISQISDQLDFRALKTHVELKRISELLDYVHLRHFHAPSLLMQRVQKLNEISGIFAYLSKVTQRKLLNFANTEATKCLDAGEADRAKPYFRFIAQHFFETTRDAPSLDLLKRLIRSKSGGSLCSCRARAFGSS